MPARAWQALAWRDVARGFESKNVEWQQQQAEERRRGDGPAAISAEERAKIERRRSLEMGLAKTRADLVSATRPAHRELLERTLAALEKDLRELPPERP